MVVEYLEIVFSPCTEIGCFFRYGNHRCSLRHRDGCEKNHFSLVTSFERLTLIKNRHSVSGHWISTPATIRAQPSEMSRFTPMSCRISEYLLRSNGMARLAAARLSPVFSLEPTMCDNREYGFSRTTAFRRLYRRRVTWLATYCGWLSRVARSSRLYN